MTMYLSNRDGNGKTSEEGHYKFQTAVFSGNALGATGLLVKQNSPLGRNVLVSAGQYKIDTSGDYSYTGWNTADEVVAITTADPANPRITSIVLYVDKGATTSPTPPNNPGITKLMAVNGTAGAIPVAPNGTAIQSAVGAGNPYIILANVRVNAAATQIVTANITDTRSIVTVGTDMVGTNSILNNAVTTAKISDGAVTVDKIATNAITTAKVADAAVTDTKWRNGIAFYANRSAARTVGASTWAVMAADAIAYNYGNMYSNTSNAGRFTATVKGVYNFSASLYTEANAMNRSIIDIRKNGVENRLADITGTTISNQNGTKSFELNVGDYVEAWYWTAANTNIASNRSFFCGHLITRT